MNEREDNALDWVIIHMPEVLDALIRFTEQNPNYRGSRWDDVLDMMFDTDAHLSVTEPLYSHPEIREMGPLPAAIALTLVWASKEFRNADAEAQYRRVLEVLERGTK